MWSGGELIIVGVLMAIDAVREFHIVNVVFTWRRVTFLPIGCGILALHGDHLSREWTT